MTVPLPTSESGGNPREQAINRVRGWFALQAWQPFSFQQKTWCAYLSGSSGLIHAPTGTGKSYAAWLGPVIEWLTENPGCWESGTCATHPLTVLWVTPLRALATDTAAALAEPIEALVPCWRVATRTGDTSSSQKASQRRNLPTCLVTTPESLTVLLSYPHSEELFASLRCVVVDEWHELLGTKRGTQTELALARLRRWLPCLRVWGISATLGNLNEAMQVLVHGIDTRAPVALIQADEHKSVQIDTILPDDITRFPWAGHIGLKLLPKVAAAIRSASTTLVFTNTRAQTEIWFQALIDEYIEFAGEIGIHHGSLEPRLRQEVETRLRDGRLRCVVCTSSLDLGIDFAPVDQVIQIGGPKGVGRLLQRAGRSGHQPGGVSRILCVPTHAFELIEFAAVRDAMQQQLVESRPPLEKPLDVLVQHIVTMAACGGFVGTELFHEVRSSYAYRNLTDEDWQWALQFVANENTPLQAYPQYAKLVVRAGRYRVRTSQILQLHRMSIGTITSDGMLKVRHVRGRSLGTVEESFLARLRPEDRFVFAGRVLELVRIKDMTAYVRNASGGRGVVPRWNGGRLPLSTHLAGAVGECLARATAGSFLSAEMTAVRPLVQLQAEWSSIPRPNQLLIERARTREGHHIFAYPLAGRAIHEGLAALLAYRLTQSESRTVSAFATDYGFELMSPNFIPLDDREWQNLLDTQTLVDDVLSCLNTTELARRQFRDIARIAGLVFSGYPGRSKNSRQLQASSGIIYDVFSEHDPENLLLDQARREVLEQQLDLSKLRTVLAELAGQPRLEIVTPRLTPFAFPIWSDRIRTQVSSETWPSRIESMVVELERHAEQVSVQE